MQCGLKIEQTAPDFEGEDQFKNRFRLRAYRGLRNVLLVFYDFDWNPSCSMLLSGIQNELKALEKGGFQVAGVSVDSVYSHRAWAGKLNLGFPLVSDFSREITRKYGLNEPAGNSRRAVFIIDKSGIVRFAKVCDRGETPSIENLLEQIETMRKQGIL